MMASAQTSTAATDGEPRESRPGVSVIIPSYNGERYLGEAIRAALHQSLPPLEVIVVDDGSSDGSVALAMSFGSQVRLIRQSNQGCSAARNTGLRVATGSFVAFLDQDDFWHPHWIEEQARALSNDPNAVASYTRCIGAPGFFGFGPYPPTDVSDDEFLLMLWYNAFFPPSAVLVRRDAMNVVGPFREDLECEDIEMWLRLLTIGRFVQVAQPLCNYRLHDGQFTKDIYRNLIGSKQARAAMIAQYSDLLVRAGIPFHKLWDSYRNDILLVYYRREFAAVRRLLRDYWWEHPRDWKMLVYSLVSLLPAWLVARLRGQLPSPATAHLNESAPPGCDDSQRPSGWDVAFGRIRHALAH